MSDNKRRSGRSRKKEDRQSGVELQEIGLVQRLSNQEVEGGVETILGIKRDPLVGPAVVFGLGGIFTEILHDVSLRIPPLTRRDAEQMIDQLRGKALLFGARGRPEADVEALVEVIVKVGELALALEHRLEALDLNPLMVLPKGQGVVAVDTLVQVTQSSR